MYQHLPFVQIIKEDVRKKKKNRCKYYGVKEVPKEKPTEVMVEELLESNDPKLQELLEKLKNKLDLNLNPADQNIVEELNLTPTEAAIIKATTQDLEILKTQIPITQALGNSHNTSFRFNNNTSFRFNNNTSFRFIK